MVRKKLDERIRSLIERSIRNSYRSMLVVVGDHGKDQVPNLHHIITRSQVKKRPKVLWCYKKGLGFSTHRKKRLKKIKRDKSRGLAKSSDSLSDQYSANETFELFLMSTDIQWCYYRDVHRVIGTTVGMLILQDFEALTPNLLARTVETVEGGGIIIWLLRTVTSLKQLYTMSMDVHARYRTEGSGEVVPRFNERFLLSLADCESCIVCDDLLNILPLSKKSLSGLERVNNCGGDGGLITRITTQYQTLRDLQDELRDTPHVGALLEQTKTLDQAKAVLTFLDICADPSDISGGTIVALTAGRGRGKSAAMGLSLAGALSFRYSLICVTAPEPENLVAVFEFLKIGLDQLKYKEHLDYKITYDSTRSGREYLKTVLAITLHREQQRKIVRYVRPHEINRFTSADVIAIDEAAAIPLPIVKKLLNVEGDVCGVGRDRLFLVSSTIHGYEGTGRALSLKLLSELRDKNNRYRKVPILSDARNIVGCNIEEANFNNNKTGVHESQCKSLAVTGKNGIYFSSSNKGFLREVQLATPIRYAAGDPIESWLVKLLCLDCGHESISKGPTSNYHCGYMPLKGGAPDPSSCELYHVDRDALFSYHNLSESFLQHLMGLYSSAHYKNSPNDLQMLSDAPAHSVFVLLSIAAEQNYEEGYMLPDILAVVQVALEGRISKKTVNAQLARGRRSAGDLIPWTLSQQFGDSNFAKLSGARIVRVAVHPTLQGLGYGSKAIELLCRFYNEDMVNDSCEKNSVTPSSQSNNISKDNKSIDITTSEENISLTTTLQNERLEPNKSLPPLLVPLGDIQAPALDWIGTSFGLTKSLHNFWKKLGMHTLYLRQISNELTGEYSSIMICAFSKKQSDSEIKWLSSFLIDMRRRFVMLLSGPFRDLSVALALDVLDEYIFTSQSTPTYQTKCVIDNKISEGEHPSHDLITAVELNHYLSLHDLKRLQLYGQNLCDHHLITDLLTSLAQLYFLGKLGSDFSLSKVQGALLVGMGLQHKSLDVLIKELDVPVNQGLAMFNKAVRKIYMVLHNIVEDSAKKEVSIDKESVLESQLRVTKIIDVTNQTLEEDTAEGAKVVSESLKDNGSYLTYDNLPPKIRNDPEIMKYVVKGTDKQWEEALKYRKEEFDDETGVFVQISHEKEKEIKDKDEKNQEVDNKLKIIKRKGNSKFKKIVKSKRKHP